MVSQPEIIKTVRSRANEAREIFIVGEKVRC